VPADRYDALVGNSCFASRGFLDVWRAAGGRPVAWVAETNGGVAAVLPGVEYGRGPVARFASLPDGCYGGVFADPALSDIASVGIALLDAVCDRGYAKTAIFDVHGGTPRHPEFEDVPWETLRVEIGVEDWHPPDPKLRSEIRKAERERIRIDPIDWDRHAEGFLSLVGVTARRHGQRSRYPAELFERLARLSRTDERVVWRYCEHDGRPACSQIYFVEGETLVSWQDYFDKQFSFLKPNQFMRFAVCREWYRRGARWLNLGATPEGAAGVSHYKERWGGEPLRFTSHLRWNGVGELVRRVRSLGRSG